MKKAMSLLSVLLMACLLMTPAYAADTASDASQPALQPQVSQDPDTEAEEEEIVEEEEEIVEEEEDAAEDEEDAEGEDEEEDEGPSMKAY